MPKKPHDHISEEIYQTTIRIFVFDPNHQVSVSVVFFRKTVQKWFVKWSHFCCLEEREDSLIETFFSFQLVFLEFACSKDRVCSQVRSLKNCKENGLHESSAGDSTVIHLYVFVRNSLDLSTRRFDSFTEYTLVVILRAY